LLKTHHKVENYMLRNNNLNPLVYNFNYTSKSLVKVPPFQMNEIERIINGEDLNS